MRRIKIGDDTLEINDTMDFLRGPQSLVRMINEKNGWFDSERTFGDDIALLHSEVSEAFEAFRSWGLEDVTFVECDPEKHERDGEHICKPEGVASELADVLVRLLDTADRCEIDLEKAFIDKCAYNATRGYRHGGKRV